MCGKGPANLLRLSAFLQSLQDAFNCVTSFAQDKKSVDQEFFEKVEEMLAKGYEPEISVANVKRAHVLLEFFNKNKMILSGYQHDDWSGNLKGILLRLAKAKPVITLVTFAKRVVLRYIFDHQSTAATSSYQEVKCYLIT